LIKTRSNVTAKNPHPTLLRLRLKEAGETNQNPIAAISVT
jgi:hypothetical protein